MTDTPTVVIPAVVSQARGFARRPGTIYNPTADSTFTVLATVDLEGLTANAKEKFTDSVCAFAEDFVKEIQRVEVEERDPGVAIAEITSTMVVRSNKAVRRGSTEAAEVPRTQIKKGIAQGMIICSAAGTTLFADHPNSLWQIYMIIISVSFGVIGGVYQYMTRGKS